MSDGDDRLDVQVHEAGCFTAVVESDVEVVATPNAYAVPGHEPVIGYWPSSSRGPVMTLVGFKGKNHPQQLAKRGELDEVDDRGTDPELFAELAERFGGFTLDVAAAPHNAKCERYYTRQQDGLVQPWTGRVWCNPPYSSKLLYAFVEKAWSEWGRVDGPNLIVMLVPANRPEQDWWQDLVEPHRDRPGSPLRTEYLRGRRRFVMPGETRILPNQRPPFGSGLLIWAPAT